MNTKDKERVKELHDMMQGSKIYVFSCNMCELLAQTADCRECPVYGAKS